MSTLITLSLTALSTTSLTLLDLVDTSLTVLLITSLTTLGVLVTLTIGVGTLTGTSGLMFLINDLTSSNDLAPLRLPNRYAPPNNAVPVAPIVISRNLSPIYLS